MKRLTSAFLLLCVALVAAGCSEADDGEAAPKKRIANVESGTWTVLAYEIADTDLEPFLLSDVVEMSEVGTQEGLNLVAFVDRAAGYTDEPLFDFPNWEGAKILRIDPGGAEELADLGDVDTGDPAVLRDFVAQGIADNPADNYALILSNHGAAWPGVGGDESHDHSVLTLPEIADAVGAGLEEAGVERLDLIGFDACLMGTYETAVAMAPVADRMIASQELEPGHGWNYASLEVITDDGEADVDELGQAIIEGFAGQAADEGTAESITLSYVDLGAMDLLSDAVDEFVAAAEEHGPDIAPVIGRQQAKTLAFGRSPDPTESTHMTDLGLLAQGIGEGAPEVADEAGAVAEAVDEAVLQVVNGAATKGATGISIYFPPTAKLMSGDYEQLESAGAWRSFLGNYYAVGSEIPDDEQADFAVDDFDDLFFDEDGLTVVGTFDEAGQGNLTEAIISYGVVEEDGSVTFIGEEPAFIDEDGEPVASGTYDLTALTISDGEDTTYAYLLLEVSEDETIGFVSVPMGYYEAGDETGETYQDVLLELTFDLETGDILDETYYVYDENTGTYGELTADPEAIIVPEVLNVTEDGEEEWIGTSDVGLYADIETLQYDLVPLDAGTPLWIELTVFDFGGNSDTLAAEVEVPDPASRKARRASR